MNSNRPREWYAYDHALNLIETLENNDNKNLVLFTLTLIGRRATNPNNVLGVEFPGVTGWGCYNHNHENLVPGAVFPEHQQTLECNIYHRETQKTLNIHFNFTDHTIAFVDATNFSHITSLAQWNNNIPSIVDWLEF